MSGALLWQSLTRCSLSTLWLHSLTRLRCSLECYLRPCPDPHPGRCLALPITLPLTVALALALVLALSYKGASATLCARCMHADPSLGLGLGLGLGLSLGLRLGLGLELGLGLTVGLCLGLSLVLVLGSVRVDSNVVSPSHLNMCGPCASKWCLPTSRMVPSLGMAHSASAAIGRVEAVLCGGYEGQGVYWQ